MNNKNREIALEVLKNVSNGTETMDLQSADNIRFYIKELCDLSINLNTELQETIDKLRRRNIQIADLKKKLSCFKKVAIYNCEGLLLRYEWQNINEK